MLGPLGDKMWLHRRFDVDADEIHIASMWGEDNAEIAGVELTLAKSEPCGRSRTLPGPFIGPEQLTKGRYSLQVRAPADFHGRVNVTIKH